MEGKTRRVSKVWIKARDRKIKREQDLSTLYLQKGTNKLHLTNENVLMP